jgi:hypothetical protein
MRKLLILPLLFAAACDGGGNGPVESAEFTAAEATELTRAMFGMAAGLTSAGLPGGVNFNSAPFDELNGFTVPIQETIPCTPSGSTEIEGTLTLGYDPESMGMSLEMEVSAAPRACAHRMENGDVIKITGDPDLDVHLTMAGSIGEPPSSMRVTESGAFKWTRGGSSGRCTVDLTSLLDAPTQMVTVSGTFCGFPVSETFPAEG